MSDSGANGATGWFHWWVPAWEDEEDASSVEAVDGESAVMMAAKTLWYEDQTDLTESVEIHVMDPGGVYTEWTVTVEPLKFRAMRKQ